MAQRRQVGEARHQPIAIEFDSDDRPAARRHGAGDATSIRCAARGDTSIHRVRPAAFEEESGPQFAEAPSSESPARSVVVERDELARRVAFGAASVTGRRPVHQARSRAAADATATPDATGATGHVHTVRPT